MGWWWWWWPEDFLAAVAVETDSSPFGTRTFLEISTRANAAHTSADANLNILALFDFAEPLIFSSSPGARSRWVRLERDEAPPPPFVGRRRVIPISRRSPLGDGGPGPADRADNKSRVKLERAAPSRRRVLDPELQQCRAGREQVRW